MTNLLKPQKLSKCNLIQALEWIAFGYEPVRPEDEILEDRKVYRNTLFQVENDNIDKSFISEEAIDYIQKIKKAMAVLSKQLIRGKLSFSCDDFFSDVFHGGKEISMSIVDLPCFDADITKIYPQKNYQNILVYTLGNSSYGGNWTYERVIFITKELKGLIPSPVFPQTPPLIDHKPLITKKEYTTPYLDIIDELIAERFYKNPVLSYKKKLSFEIIKKMRSKGLRESKNIADIMATILRPVELQRGGTHSFQNKKS